MAKGAKSKPTGDGMNSQSAPDQLRQFVERWERLQADKEAVAEDQKELMAEAKAAGFDTKILRKVFALRKRKPDDVAEEEAILELYLAALGMDFAPRLPGMGADDEADEGDDSDSIV